MTPDEVLEELNKLGINISRRTLLRYEENELIPKSKRSSLGRAKGRFTDYPEDTVTEAYTAYCLMKINGYEQKEIRAVRAEVLRLIESFFTQDIHGLVDDMSKDDLEGKKLLLSTQPLTKAEHEWAITWARAKIHADPNEQVCIIVNGSLNSYDKKINVVKTEEVPTTFLTGISGPALQYRSNFISIKNGCLLIFKPIELNIVFRYISPEDMKVITSRRNN